MTETISHNDAAEVLGGFTERAKASRSALTQSHHRHRQQALTEAAGLIRQNMASILAENAKDLVRAEKSNLPKPMIGRLRLDEPRIEGMAVGLEAIADLPDPLGRELARWHAQNGLDIARVSTPLGVLGVIYESRPNVTVDAAGLAIKSGNPVILRGGSDSFHTSTYLAGLIRRGLAEASLPQDCVQLLDTTDRALVGAMLTAVGGIDVLIPRGGKGLVARVQNEARVPVFAHLEGVCHVYIDKAADAQKAVDIAVNAKMRRVEVCGAMETLLVDRAIATTLLPPIATALIAAGCQLLCDKAAHALIPQSTLASADDWGREYLAGIASVKVVDGVGGAIGHIAQHGSDHTDSIITEDSTTAQKFLDAVDSAIVMVNASTQFADGGEFGMGAEIGIATGRLHARGPVGASQLTSFKYVVRGDGQCRP